MNLINYISNIAVPAVILIVLSLGLKEKKNVFDLFLKGAKDGADIVIKLFPTLVGLFLAIGSMRSSGILDFISSFLAPVLYKLNFPVEVLPLALLRPISGSGAIAIATDIMQNYGVDSLIGIIAATIMGSTETTLYVIAVYTGTLKIKKTRFVLFAALMADITGIIVSVIINQ